MSLGLTFIGGKLLFVCKNGRLF